jgi:hypothetical protein
MVDHFDKMYKYDCRRNIAYKGKQLYEPLVR